MSQSYLVTAQLYAIVAYVLRHFANETFPLTLMLTKHQLRPLCNVRRLNLFMHSIPYKSGVWSQL